MLLLLRLGLLLLLLPVQLVLPLFAHLRTPNSKPKLLSLNEEAKAKATKPSQCPKLRLRCSFEEPGSMGSGAHVDLGRCTSMLDFLEFPTE